MATTFQRGARLGRGMGEVEVARKQSDVVGRSYIEYQ